MDQAQVLKRYNLDKETFKPIGGGFGPVSVSRWPLPGR